MRGFPKHLNSKEDYLYIKNNFPAEEWKPVWQALLKESENWFYTGTLETEKDGVTDEKHKVVQSKDINGKDIFMQYELKEDSSCDMIRLGFTKEEIQEAFK